MFVPQANSIVSFAYDVIDIIYDCDNFFFVFLQGAGFGLLASFATMMWLGIGSQIAKSRGLSHNQLKLLRTDSCPLLNSTASAAISNGSM
jgi:hypothetical protein